MARNDIGPRGKDVLWENLLGAGPYVPIQLQRNSLAVQRSRVGQMRVAKSKRVRLLRQLAVTEPIHRDRRCLTLT